MLFFDKIMEFISKFEKPIYDNENDERKRLLSSCVIFHLPYSPEEFYNIFLEFITRKVLNFTNMEEDFKEGKVIIIFDDNNKPRHYTITKNKLNEELELALLDKRVLFKINVRIKFKNIEKIEIKYNESARYKEKLTNEEWKEKFSNFNSSNVNKVVTFKKYFLEKVGKK